MLLLLPQGNMAVDTLHQSLCFCRRSSSLHQYALGRGYTNKTLYKR